MSQHRTHCALCGEHGARILVSCALALMFPLGCNSGAGGGSEPNVRAGTGAGSRTPKALVEEKCSPCHDLGRIQAKQADAKGWAAIVDDMERRGLSVSAAERKQIVDYLAAH